MVGDAHGSGSTKPPSDSSASPPAGGSPAPDRRATFAGTESPSKEFRRGLLSLLTGTRPGLERFLLASVPALTVGAVGAALFGRWVGLAAGAVTLAAIMLLARRMDGP
jgi:hypothetical protein